MLLLSLSFLFSLAFWLWIIRKYDKFEREPLKALLLVLILGGIMSVVPAGLLNVVFGSWLGQANSNGVPQWPSPGIAALYFAFVGINEETFKALATILLIRRMKGFNEPADALVYAMTVALGFAMIENVGYVVQYGYATLLIRQFNAVPLHIGLAAIWGVGIARAKFIRNGHYFLTVLPYLLLAALIHTVYNGLTLVISPGIALVSCSVIAWLLIRSAIRRVGLYASDGPFANRLFCHNCHTENFPDARRCKKCGQPFSLEFYILCSQCNRKIARNENSCPGCGALTDKPGPAEQ